MHKEHKHVKGKQKWLVFYFISNSPIGLSKAMTRKERKELWVFSLYNVSVFYMEFPGGQDILLKTHFMSMLMKAWQITSHLSVKIKGTSTQLASYFDGKTSTKKWKLKDLEKSMPYVLWNFKIISNIFLSYKNSKAKKTPLFFHIHEKFTRENTQISFGSVTKHSESNPKRRYLNRLPSPKFFQSVIICSMSFYILMPYS